MQNLNEYLIKDKAQNHPEASLLQQDNEKLKDLETLLSQKDHETGRLSKRVEELSAKLSETMRLLGESRVKIADLNKTNQARHDELQILQAQLSNLSNKEAVESLEQRSQHEAELEEARKQLNDLRQKLENAEQISQKSQKQKELLASRNQELEQELEAKCSE